MVQSRVVQSFHVCCVVLRTKHETTYEYGNIPVPVAARLLLGLQVRIPPGKGGAGGVGCLLCVLCTVWQIPLRLADHYFRRVLPNVVHLSVIVKPPQ